MPVSTRSYTIKRMWFQFLRRLTAADAQLIILRKPPLYSCQSYLVGWPTNLPTGYNNLFSFGLVGKCPLTMYLHLSGTDIQQCSATFWQLWHMTPMCRQFLDLCSIKSRQLSWLRPLDGNVKKEWYWAWNLFTRKPTLIIHSSHFPEELNCW